ncbi:TIGR04540 family protein [Clostridium tarantellae]|uniref:TIGR04540 family protein n=1 Tax=Clostridium tarantellae TaxID=39493 RepID=A0A6I1MY58_9CLOT|nr:TIGR04540 family protein [Clostridium tarantellae]MPQ45069.1 TIGR04540 family protein [Clostridium tarantellae]
MRAVYRNPKELATKIKDVVDAYQENLISYEKLEQTVLKMIEVNEDRVYKNGHMPVKLSNVLGEERVEIIDKIAKSIK